VIGATVGVADQRVAPHDPADAAVRAYIAALGLGARELPVGASSRRPPSMPDDFRAP
jgi:hypothetical protein